jgi:hypothetical protein
VSGLAPDSREIARKLDKEVLHDTGAEINSPVTFKSIKYLWFVSSRCDDLLDLAYVALFLLCAEGGKSQSMHIACFVLLARRRLIRGFRFRAGIPR